MSRIRVVIADDHAVLRAGLRLLINSQPDMETVGEAGNFSEALILSRAVRPAVLILDLTMPGGNGVQMIEHFVKELTQTRILVLTMHDDPTYLRAALAAGAFGYVVKKAADVELVSAIRAVSQGRAFVDLDLSGARVQTILSAAGTEPGSGSAGPADSLSHREREVLELLAQGHTNQVVADQLCLSVKTVESYRARLMQKLGLASRADLIRYAVEVGLLLPGKLKPTSKPHS